MNTTAQTTPPLAQTHSCEPLASVKRKQLAQQLRRAVSAALTMLALIIAFQPQSAMAAWTQATGTVGIRFVSMSKIGTTIYAGALAGGLYQSTDDGATWTTAFGTNFAGWTPQVVTQIGSVLYVGGGVGTAAKLAYSVDSGANWSFQTSWGSSSTITDVALMNGATYVAARGVGVYKSTANDGTGWSLANTGMQTTPVKFAQVGTDIFVSDISNNGTDGIFKSSNGGANWTRAATGLPGSGGAGGQLINYKGTLFLGIGSGVYVSSDSGATWSLSLSGSPQGLAINNATLYFSKSFSNALYTNTNDGSGWTLQNVSGIVGGSAYLQPGIVLTGGKLLLSSGDGIWREVDPAPTYSLTISTPTNGSVASNTGGISCGSTCTGYYVSNSSVTLTATPATGYAFSSWGGDCAGTTSPLTLTITLDTACSATFAIPNAAPVASSVSITGTPPLAGQPLTGTYVYSDAESDPQDIAGTVLRWVTNTINTGVAGGTSVASTLSYTPAVSDQGKYLYFCVTPAAGSGTTPGAEACSSATAALGAAPIPTLAVPAVTGYANQANFSLQADYRSTLFFTVIAGASTCPADTVIEAHSGSPLYWGSTTLSAATQKLYALRNLAPSTNYKLCAVAKANGSTNYSSVQAVAFSTVAGVNVNNGVWAKVGAGSGTSGMVSPSSKTPQQQLGVALGSDGNPYMVYYDSTSGFGYVRKFNGSSWNDVGGSIYGVTFPTLVLAPDDTPYLVYVDKLCPVGGGDYKATVKRFDGIDWVAVGSTCLSAGAAIEPVIAIAPDGTPYIAYRDASTSLIVQKFDGSTWVAVGAPGLTTNSHALAFGADGLPYIATQDSGSSYKASVIKFDGTTWNFIGARGFSAGQALQVSLAVAPSGQLLVAYGDVTVAQKLSVMKFNGTSWVSQGGAGMSPSTAGQRNVAFGPGGGVYVGYADYSFGGVSVQTFDGSAWSYLGSQNFTSASVNAFFAMDFDRDGWLYAGVYDSTWNYPGMMKTVAPPAAAPTATSVALTGTAQVGVQLTGSYTYGDVNGDLEDTSGSGSSFRFVRSTDNSIATTGDNSNAATGTTGGVSQTYTLTASDQGKYLFYCVTPRTTTGTFLVGTEVCSSAGSAVVAAPTVSSVTLVGTPAASATSISFSVTFSQAVSGVDASDFTLTATGSASGTIGMPSTSDNVVWTVPISSVAGSGTIRLDLNSSGTGIAATATGNAPVSGGYTTGSAHTVTPPNVAPVFVGATTTLTVAQGAGATDIKALLHVSDSDAGQTETWTQSVAPSHGTLSLASASASSGATDITPGGTITYTPTAGYAGPDSFTVQVSDGLASATRSISVTVSAPTVTVNALTLNSMTVGTAFVSQSFSGAGGYGAYTYSVSSGALPAGLSLNSTTGALSGTPTTAGAYSFTIQATDSSTGTGPYSGTRAFSGTVAARPTSYSAPAPTGSGTVSASFSGGSNGCGYSTSRYIPLTGDAGSPPAGTAPSGYVFPHGLFDFTATGCTEGATLTFTISYPQAFPAGTVYWKYGPTPTNATPHWYQLPATISGNVVTFSITDGGLGDDDLSANGTVVDQGGPATPPASNATSIPTLSEWGMIILSSLIAMVSLLRGRGRRLG